MEELDASVSQLTGRITELEQALAQSQAELQDLKRAHEQERMHREHVEAELMGSQQLLQLVMDTLPTAIFWKNRDSVFLGCNRNFAENAGLSSPDEIVGKTDYDLPWKPEETEFYRACDRRVMLANQPEFGIIEPQLNSAGEQTWVETNKAPLHDSQGYVIGMLGTYQDVTQRKRAEVALQELNQKLELQTLDLRSALAQLKQSQLQLIQREKMSALGNLIAGIAHEVNNPVGFLVGNLQPAHDYIDNLFRIIDLYQAAFPNPGREIEQEIEAIDLEYLRQDFPQLLQSMHEGIDRIKNISTSLRTFSRSDINYQVPFNIHEGLDSTLMILKHRFKANGQRPAINVVKRYQEMPLIRCFPGQLNQVFMNLLANAIDALEESSQASRCSDINAQSHQITITTELSICQQLVMVTVEDNGIGMTEEVQQRIFSDSFTTKEVGKGTGLGLAIAHHIIVEKHGGAIDVASTLGQGTAFVLTIPIHAQADA